MSQADGSEDGGIARPAVGRVAKVIVPIGIFIGLIAGCTSTTIASPLVTATSTKAVTPTLTMNPSPLVTVTTRMPLSTRLLTGTFAVPSGFLVASINPLVPADAAPFGEVDASVTSPGGVAYGVVFSPTVVPCDYAACTSRTTALAVGDAAPASVQVTIDPGLGAPAQCGYDSDAGEVGCDAISGKEYIAVRGILCGTCNWALGNARDRPDTLRRLAAYLESQA
jgi:Recombination endonuclease VII